MPTTTTATTTTTTMTTPTFVTTTRVPPAESVRVEYPFFVRAHPVVLANDQGRAWVAEGKQLKRRPAQEVAKR